ncbi:MAG: hypothetical protein ABIJ42_06980 [Acidobacteriota bacterium]
MGVFIKRFLTRKKLDKKGFSLLEQLIAIGLIITGSVCALESIAFCLISLQVSEKKWDEDLIHWNESQAELLEEDINDYEQYNSESIKQH